MAIEIGVLLGAPGGGQSFENVGSWAVFSGVSSLALQASDVHSSGQGGLLTVASGTALGSRALSYPYAADFLACASPDVTTHTAVALAWARLDRAASSGGLALVWSGGTAVPIPYATGVQPLRLDVSNLASGQALALDVQVLSATVSSLGVYLDDVTVYADPFNPGADIESSARAEAIMLAREATLGGFDIVYPWATRPRWTLAIPSLPSSLARMVNRWSAQSRTLLYNADTSDSAARGLVRLGGDPPAHKLRTPYTDVAPLALTLEGLSGDLVF